MRYAVDVAPLGELADPRVFSRIAAAAETAGWDGVSTWDVLATTMGGAADPFVALAAAASATERIRVIVSVIALARRRP
jgi:alkanesulfonate monooxygenase SsuD/methylene tetrahydromethanopterin reductase-like flavin-dependent oxidoreductase (luciferase family)